MVILFNIISLLMKFEGEIMDYTNILKLQWSIKKLYDKALEKTAKKYDLSLAEVNVLLFLHNNKKLNNAKDIVKYRGFTKGYVSQALKKLNIKGYINILTNEKDKREQQITINISAEELVKELSNKQKLILKKMTTNIKEDDLKLMKKSLLQMNDNLRGVE
jgi:DNA-binding MarR family transcriptional regulator